MFRKYFKDFSCNFFLRLIFLLINFFALCLTPPENFMNSFVINEETHGFI